MNNEPTTVPVIVRDNFPPYRVREVEGHAPFEVFGERFAVTAIPCRLPDDVQQWRATHVESGCGVPDTNCATIDMVETAARIYLDKVGPQKLKEAIAKAYEIIARGQPGAPAP